MRVDLAVPGGRIVVNRARSEDDAHEDLQVSIRSAAPRAGPHAPPGAPDGKPDAQPSAIGCHSFKQSFQT